MALREEVFPKGLGHCRVICNFFDKLNIIVNLLSRKRKKKKHLKPVPNLLLLAAPSLLSVPYLHSGSIVGPGCLPNSHSLSSTQAGGIL